ncbi:hypothetical protein [Labilithrix luteola]|uniref:hypothetical protein n=1 Tax=Labilithrix luteola TaxID=1391654 RepID=UPI0011BA4DCD|nr:hypothetical protein [Labilithrix luteola]
MPNAPERAPSKKASRLDRLVYGVFIALTAAFVVSSIVQVASELFFTDEARPKAAGAAGPAVNPACAERIGDMIHAIDVARLEASHKSDRDTALHAYSVAKDAAWARYGELTRACESDPNGVDALAALDRFERAAERDAIRQAVELGRVRRSVDSFIR